MDNTNDNTVLVPLNDETRWILGRPNFWCASVAQILRKDGHKIKKKAKDEQASVIHWFLNLYLEHGDKWRDVAQSESNRIKNEVANKSSYYLLSGKCKCRNCHFLL